MPQTQSAEAHLRIAHSIEEQIMVSRFSENQRRILDLILRLSWGCGKITAFIPRQRDFQVTGIGESRVKEQVDWLIDARVIVRQECYYAFNKDFNQWRVSRALKYGQEKLTELVKLNLKTPDTQLTPEASPNLSQGEETTCHKGKLPEPEPASPKERLNKYIKKNSNYLDIISGSTLETANSSPREAAEIWSKVLVELRLQVSAANYRIWLEKSAGLGYFGRDFLVKVENPSVAGYLNSNLRSLLEKTLIGVAQREFTICFVEPGQDTC